MSKEITLILNNINSLKYFITPTRYAKNIIPINFYWVSSISSKVEKYHLCVWVNISFVCFPFINQASTPKFTVSKKNNVVIFLSTLSCRFNYFVTFCSVSLTISKPSGSRYLSACSISSRAARSSSASHWYVPGRSGFSGML